MNEFDPEKVARVWQRVQGNSPQAASMPQKATPDLALSTLMEEIAREANLYSVLSRRFSNGDSALLRRLAQETRSQAACLQGIQAMTAGIRPVSTPSPVPKERSGVLLRRCYGQALRRFREYESRTADPAFGPVFARLADQTGEHCRIVLEILGRFNN